MSFDQQAVAKQYWPHAEAEGLARSHQDNASGFGEEKGNERLFGHQARQSGEKFCSLLQANPVLIALSQSLLRSRVFSEQVCAHCCISR